VPGTYAEKGRFTVKTSIAGTDGSIADARTEVANLSTTASGGVGGVVPATLGLSLGAPATFGAFTPGVSKDYVASMTANVVSTAGDAAVGVADPSAVASGHLVNGTFSLPSALEAKTSSPAGSGGAFADVTVATLLSSYPRPASNDPVALTFQRHIGASDPLRTDAYSKTLTFTLSTTNP
jgi:hypothetical protein